MSAVSVLGVWITEMVCWHKSISCSTSADRRNPFEFYCENVWRHPESNSNSGIQYICMCSCITLNLHRASASVSTWRNVCVCKRDKSNLNVSWRMYQKPYVLVRTCSRLLLPNMHHEIFESCTTVISNSTVVMKRRSVRCCLLIYCWKVVMVRYILVLP